MRSSQAGAGDDVYRACAEHCTRSARHSTTSRDESVRGKGSGNRAAVMEPEASKAWELQRRVAHIDSGHETKEIEFDALDPSELDAEKAPQGCLDAGAAVGEPDIRLAAEILAHGVWW